jgi:hypothetical protein
MRFDFVFELGQAEHIRACRAMYHRKAATRAVYAVALVTVAAGAIWYVRMLAAGVMRDAFVALVLVAGSLAAGLATYLSPYWLVRGMRKRSRAAAGPHEYTLDESGIAMRSPGATGTLAWPNVVEALETPEFLLFYVSSDWSAMLPKRVIADQDLPRLRDAIRGWVTGSARLMTT